ncbi:MAG: hypothetical protein ABGX27_06575 [Desulfurobacteriaceae bacterium]
MVRKNLVKILTVLSLVLSSCGTSPNVKISYTPERKAFIEKTSPLLTYKASPESTAVKILLFKPKVPILITFPIPEAKKILLVRETSAIGVDRIWVEGYDYFFEDGELDVVYYVPYIYLVDGAYKSTLEITYVDKRKLKEKKYKNVFFFWKPMEKSSYPYSFEYLPPISELIEKKMLDKLYDEDLRELKKEIHNVSIDHFYPSYKEKIRKLKEEL